MILLNASYINEINPHIFLDLCNVCNVTNPFFQWLGKGKIVTNTTFCICNDNEATVTWCSHCAYVWFNLLKNLENIQYLNWTILSTINTILGNFSERNLDSKQKEDDWFETLQSEKWSFCHFRDYWRIFGHLPPSLWGFSRYVTSSSDLNLKMSETEEFEDLVAVALPGAFSQQPVYSFT